MERAVYSSTPRWMGENQEVETAMIIECGGAEYRQTEGQEGSSQGRRAGWKTDGAEPKVVIQPINKHRANKEGQRG